MPRGGKRKGAGRPKRTEPTERIVVPISLLGKIRKIILEYKKKLLSTTQ